jgi:hypothetical protein
MKYVVTDDEIYAWAVRHDLSFGGSSVDARAAFEDAQSFAQTLGEPVAVPDAIAGPGVVMSKQDVRDAYYAEGWNACREATLSAGRLSTGNDNG